jgi:hypothetical protein
VEKPNDYYRNQDANNNPSAQANAKPAKKGKKEEV